MIVRICDRCGKTIKKNYPTLDRVYSEENSVKILKEFDLCKDCWDAFYNWMREVPEEQEEKVAQEEDSEKIDELELSVRAYNALKRSGLNTIDDVCKLTKEELCGIKNLGKVSVDEVIAHLAVRGRYLFDAEEVQCADDKN